MVGDICLARRVCLLAELWTTRHTSVKHIQLCTSDSFRWHSMLSIELNHSNICQQNSQHIITACIHHSISFSVQPKIRTTYFLRLSNLSNWEFKSLKNMLISMSICSPAFIIDMNCASCSLAWQGFLKHFGHHFDIFQAVAVITNCNKEPCVALFWATL